MCALAQQAHKTALEKRVGDLEKENLQLKEKLGEEQMEAKYNKTQHENKVMIRRQGVYHVQRILTLALHGH